MDWLEQELFALSGTDRFTVRQACEGVQIFGGIGSGKSSGSGATIARSYLAVGMGGLVLTAKPDERKQWEQYAAETGRTADLVVFDASGQYGFNFLRYEMQRPGAGGGYSGNVVRLFTNIVEAVEGQKSGGGDNQFWIMAMQQLIRNAVDLCFTARGKVSLPMLYDVVQSAPRSIEELYSEAWQESSLVNALVNEAIEGEDGRDRWMQHDFDAAARYWMSEFPQMDERVRSSIISQFTTMAGNFIRRPFRQLFCHKTTLLPELCFEGKIIILDLPVKEFAAAGRAAQVMFKFIWQQAMERRDVTRHPRPVFLWADEAQNFVSEYDMQFQATARSSRCCTVYITQNLPNYYAEMGTHAKDRTHSLVGNFATKIWHANSDPETNRQAAETIGRSWQQKKSSGMNLGSGGAGTSSNVSWQFEYDVPPQAFTMLKKGGPDNGLEVEAIVFQNGRIFDHSEKTNLQTVFHQQ